MAEQMRIKKLLDTLRSHRIGAVAAEEHVHADRYVEFFRFGVKRKIVWIAEMAAFHIGKERCADKTQIHHRSAQLVHAGFDILLRQGRRAFDALGICRAIFGKPGIARRRQGSSEPRILQSRKRPGQSRAKKNRDIDSLAVHIDYARFGIRHSRTARMRTVIGTSDADPQTARSRPGFAFDNRPELTIAARTSFRRLAFVARGQALFPVDMVFFNMAVGIDGWKSSHGRLPTIRCSTAPEKKLRRSWRVFVSMLPRWSCETAFPTLGDSYLSRMETDHRRKWLPGSRDYAMENKGRPGWRTFRFRRRPACSQ